VFVTTIRDPMERWYSQYRYDYIEGRFVLEDDIKGPKKSFVEWYHKYKAVRTCRNIFVNAFIGQVCCVFFILIAHGILTFKYNLIRN
jgi:hypothetical protein